MVPAPGNERHGCRCAARAAPMACPARKPRILCLLLAGLLFLLGGCRPATEDAPRLTLAWYLRGEDEALFNSLKGIAKIEEATGIDIEFVMPPDNSEDAYKMMVASGNLPDIITWKFATSVDRLYLDDVAIDATALIAAHAPNLTALYDERPELLKQVQTIDERLYYFPSINPMLTPEDRCRKAFNGLVIRSDWLEKLGLSMPETIDGWYAALSAFRTMDPNGNGLDDEIPFDGWGLPYFMPAFGILNGFCIKEDGSVAYGYLEQEYKAYLEEMHKWYKEGLIGKNSIVFSSKSKDENIISNLTGAFQGLDNAWRYYLPPLQEKDGTAQFAAVPWPLSESGRLYTPIKDMATNISTTITFITTQCAHPEEAARLIDYCYTEEGSSLLTWGIEGETYAIIDGRKQLLPEAFDILENGYMRLHTYAIGHMAFPKYDGEMVVLQSYPEEQLLAEQVWADCDTGLVYPPNLVFDPADDAIANSIMPDIESYVTDMDLKFITGEEPISNFDQFVATLRRMGIDEALAVYERNYQAYQQR